jgi:hypothetical protein
LPPCANYFRPAAFVIANIIYFFEKQAVLIRRSTKLSFSLKLVLKGLSLITKRASQGTGIEYII